jgi:hypothetical protein
MKSASSLNKMQEQTTRFEGGRIEFRGINSAASDWLKNPSLGKDSVRNVAVLLRPGNSAIFALIPDWQSAASVLSGCSHLLLLHRHG